MNLTPFMDLEMDNQMCVTLFEFIETLIQMKFVYLNIFIHRNNLFTIFFKNMKEIKDSSFD